MSLFDGIRLNMLRSGNLSLKNLPISYGFDEKFVEAALLGNGCEEFKYASDWLKSDAEFILKMLGKYPGILEHAASVIIDRYKDESGILREKEMDGFLFAAMCCSRNVESYKYLTQKDAERYLECVKESKSVVGEYHGEEKEVSLAYTEFYVDRLKRIRYGITKMGDLLSSIL